MEDDDGEMPVTTEEPREDDKPMDKHQQGRFNTKDISDSEKSGAICSLDGKNGNVAAIDCKDSVNPKIKNVLGLPDDVDSETNNSESQSDSEVPLNPQKVNGEVELSKYSEKDEGAEDSMDTVILVKGDVPENEDDYSEQDKRTFRKCKRSISSNEFHESEDVSHDDAGDHKGAKKQTFAHTSTTVNCGCQEESMSSEVDPSVKCTNQSRNPTSPELPVIISPPPLQDGVESSAQLTEYAQYLGLQPTVKFKCYRCGETGFPSMPVLQEHQNICFKTLNKSQPFMKPTQTTAVEPTPSTNFRITRKVYLCSVCGTYYENWNLFLHIREVHKRHICLFCLGMFAHSDNLVSHLSLRHGVIEESFSSADDFLNEYKGSCFLMCCTCEKLFTERENFFDHNCVEGLSVSIDKACSLCGLKGAHFPTCRQAFIDSDASPPQSTSSVSTALKGPEDTDQDSQLILQEQPAKKQITLSVNKEVGKKDNNKEGTAHENMENNEKLRDLSDFDDDYDISNAASFCHVNIHETPEKNKANVEKDSSKKDILVSSSKNKTATEIPLAKQAELDDKQNVPNVEENLMKDKTEMMCVEPVNDEPKINEIVQNEQGPAEQRNDEEGTPLESDVTKSTERESESNKDTEGKIPRQLETDKSCSEQDMQSGDINLDNIADQKLDDELQNIQKQEDPDARSTPKSEGGPKSPPKLETQSASKTPSATEAESESETSDSGEETDESSSSSESSDESNHHEDDVNNEKLDGVESDIDNADSDKMSLIVDETKSEDEKEIDEERNDVDEMQSDRLRNNKDMEKEGKGELNESKSETGQESENENNLEALEGLSEKKEIENKTEDFTENIQLAGDEVPLLELTLEENLDILSIQALLKECVKISCLNCVYCNHAKKIAVNGKQLALHLLAEHRFAPVVCSDSGELTEVYGFIDRLKSSLSDLQQMYFNTDSYDNMDPNCICQYDRTYECFHCHFVTTLHKELYVHNRKMHQKTILLCIMCKSNFYSYSELLCHLCPGIYVPESNITFHCCLCTVDGLPSAFRLMVHLRKRHHACDVCLETTGDQQKLSNHVWKHKLHHLCYRCGIAYRNKPDITKHLFWKHGTESVLCKKCLQKKWPHVYHFCIPPNAFVCEECNGTFTRAVALKVHKRIHSGDLPYACDECEERYISRKLLIKHQHKHREPPVEENVENKMEENGPSSEMESQKEKKVSGSEMLHERDEMKERPADYDTAEKLKLVTGDEETEPVAKGETSGPDTQIETSIKDISEEHAKLDEKETEKKSRVVDVYDLPPLNLSSESDDSDEEEKEKIVHKEEKNTTSEAVTQPAAAVETKSEDADKNNEMFPAEEQPVPIVDGIWDNFKNYKASLERRESQQAEMVESSTTLAQDTTLRERESAEVIEIINMDHDYCGPAAGPSHSRDIIDETENALISSEVAKHSSVQENVSILEELKEKVDEDKKPVDADHNYCYNNSASPSSNIEKEKETLPTPSLNSPSKKKQKSPKKKQKRSGSSSSSESSSNSDSSSCSCGTNCSCSSSSSSSSGSSSSSSDSDSSTSEGRRRQAARRERRRERAKKRKSEEILDAAPAQVEVTDAADPAAAPQNVTVTAKAPEPEETEMPIKESDLDTDETETDEDFYDKYPQKLANKLLAEKRNQLLLLAAVAPVNNGTMTQTNQSPLTSSVEEQSSKKKAKTKKRKRSLQHTNMDNNTEKNVKMNIPSDYYSGQNPTFSKSSLTPTTLSPLHPSSQSHPVVSNPDPTSVSTTYHSTGSGSETESKRLSKRKRVPKRFYGDSSDEETEQQPATKWRKVVSTTSGSPLQSSISTSAFAYKSASLLAPEARVPPAVAVEDKSEEEAAEDSDSDVRKSSSDSSNSESEAEKEDDASDGDSDADSVSPFQTNTSTSVKEGETGQQKNENLYCYCQCPYDEVSEMIACDGKDCTIEWFHFECVGIMVPPKGKWFCPDCRKRATSRSDYVPNV